MKKTKKTIFTLVIIMVISTLTFWIGKQIGLNTDTSSTNTTIEEKTVGTQTIKKTVTASGEIETANTEKLTISTTKYFETMCVEEEDIVKEGENILKYADGTYLIAPYDCVVASYSIPETKTKATENHYIEIKDIKNVKTTLSINENEIAGIALDKEVEIVLTADTNKTYIGKVSKIDAIGTYATSGTTFSVVVSFEIEEEETTKLGMSVSCTIVVKELENVIAVPVDSVQTTDNKKYVIIIDNGETREVEIQTGLSNDEYVEVTSGLTGGETIQVITTTKQNTIRGNSTNGNKNEDSGQRDEKRMEQEEGMQMPPNRKDGEQAGGMQSMSN